MSNSSPLIRAMQSSDSDAVLAIYQQGIDTGHATFAANAPSWADWDDGHLATCRLVAENEQGNILGWAALSGVSSRCVYAGVAEVSLYVCESAKGQGLGSHLMQALIEASEQDGIWTLQAGIFPENIGSLALHEKCGFKRLGLREKLGKMTHGPMRGRWRDVIFVERRSDVTGCN